MIPLFLSVHFRDRDRDVRLWFPLIVIWLLMLPIVLLALPFVVIAAAICAAAGFNLFAAIAAIFALLAATRGTVVEVESPDHTVFIRLS
jgi:hypothetical protein